MPSVDIAGLGQFGVFRRPTPYDPVRILGKILTLQLVYTILLVLLTWSMSARGWIIRDVFDPEAFLSLQASPAMLLYVSGSLLIALLMYIFVVLESPRPLDVLNRV